METDAYIQAMFGKHAFRVPMNFIIQGDINNPAQISGVWQGESPEMKKMLFNSKKAHQLILGDIVIRPHLVLETDAFIGMGINGIYKDGFRDLDKWITHGATLLNLGARNF